jgi:hypothetical protein
MPYWLDCDFFSDFLSLSKVSSSLFSFFWRSHRIARQGILVLRGRLYIGEWE